MNFSDLQKLLKDKLEIEHLADIARELGVSPQAVSNWKARDKVPYKYIVKTRNLLKEMNLNNKGDIKNDETISHNKIKQNKQPDYMYDENISLSDLFLIIARQFRTIIITPTIFCIITLIYLFFIAEPIYESSAKIMSSSGGDNVSQAAGLAAQFGIALPTGQSAPEWVYPEIIKSRTLAKAMLKRKFDTEKYGTQKTLLQILTYGNNKMEQNQYTLLRTGVNNVINMIDIQRNGNFYDLTISAFEPNFAKDFTVALIEELDSHQRRHNKQKTSETRKFIEERIEDTRLELVVAEENLKDFNDRNRRIENSPSLQLERQRLYREVSVLTGVFTTLKQQLETSKIEEVKELDYVVLLDPPEVPLNRSKPNRKLMMVLSGLLGIGLGVFLAFIKEYVENTKSDDQKKIYQAKSLIINNIFGILPQRFKKN